LLGTYGGNAVSCAAALAVLDVFEEEDILGNCMTREQEMRSRLNTFFGSNKSGNILREVRGRGLMIGEQTIYLV
jgi:4-aminobutyrate aminotransferase